MSNKDFVDALTQLGEAQKLRREELSKQVASTLPEFILSIEASSVTITLNIGLMPYRQIDAHEFIRLLKNSYHLSFSPENVSPDINFKTLISPDLDEVEIVEYLLKLNEFSIPFVDGRFSTGSNSFVPIIYLFLTQESIIASVSGDTKYAELLISEVFELLWQTSGITRRWYSDDVQKKIIIKTYGTSTKVDFGFSLSKLLNNDLFEYINKNLTEGQKLASAMTTRSSYDNFQVRPDVFAVMYLDDLILKFNLTDKRKGRSEEAEIKWSVMSRDEGARTIADVSTQMPYDQHVTFIKELIEHLKDA